YAALPAVSLQIEQVVGEYRLAFEQVEAVPAEATAHRRDHSLRAALGNGDLGGDSVVLVHDTRSIPDWNVGILTMVGEFCFPCDRTRSRCKQARQDRVIQRQNLVFLCFR